MTFHIPVKSQQGDGTTLEVADRGESVQLAYDRDQEEERRISLLKKEFLKLDALLGLGSDEDDTFALTLSPVHDSANTLPNNSTVRFTVKDNHITIKFENPEKVYTVAHRHLQRAVLAFR